MQARHVIDIPDTPDLHRFYYKRFTYKQLPNFNFNFTFFDTFKYEVNL